MQFAFPAATLIALLVSTVLLLSMSEFVTNYFKIVSKDKYREHCSISPRLLTTGIVSVVFWIIYNSMQTIFFFQRDGAIQIPILNDFNLIIPIALTVSFLIGSFVFLFSSFFYKSIEDVTPKKESGDILSEMLFRKI